MAHQPVSGLAAALAANSSNDHSAREGITTGAGHLMSLAGASTSAGRKAMLPTPPNSISPGLPPHKARSPQFSTASSGLQQPDSDIDLQEAVDHARSAGNPQALSTAALSGLEAAGIITPGMLAKDYLPKILLDNGPMAIRHVLGHLTHSVPGFSRIPPAKARRLVVGALENKAGGGPDGNVLFEKVGWGRWDARLRGQPPREGRTNGAETTPDGHLHLLGVSPPPSFAGSYSQSAGLHISNAGWDARRGGASWVAESMLSSRGHDDVMEEEDVDMDMNMLEHEADKMSLDGRDDSGVSSVAPEDMPITDDPEDATDDEDWAAIGAEALRRGSTVTGTSQPRRDYNYLSMSHTSRMKPVPTISRTHSAAIVKPIRIQPTAHRHHSFAAASGRSLTPAGRSGAISTSCGFVALSGHNAQEQEAVEALLRMGSM